MDVIGWFIGNLHQLLGHEKTAQVLGVEAGDKAECLLCRFERGDPDVPRERVIAAIGGRR